jgi:hypothetical protein
MPWLPEGCVGSSRRDEGVQKVVEVPELPDVSCGSLNLWVFARKI